MAEIYRPYTIVTCTTALECRIARRNTVAEGKRDCHGRHGKLQCKKEGNQYEALDNSSYLKFVYIVAERTTGSGARHS